MGVEVIIGAWFIVSDPGVVQPTNRTIKINSKKIKGATFLFIYKFIFLTHPYENILFFIFKLEILFKKFDIFIFHNMVISQKAKNIFNRLYIWCVADNFIINYDFLVIIML